MEDSGSESGSGGSGDRREAPALPGAAEARRDEQDDAPAAAQAAPPQAPLVPGGSGIWRVAGMFSPSRVRPLQISTTSATARNVATQLEVVQRAEKEEVVQWSVYAYMAPPRVELAWGCLREHHPFRARCLAIYNSLWFERLVMFLIIANGVALATGNPAVRPRRQRPRRRLPVACGDRSASARLSLTLAPRSQQPDASRDRVLNALEIFFNTAFSVEVIIKTTALGFAMGKGTYLSDPWNRLDLVVVVLGCVAPRARCTRAPSPREVASRTAAPRPRARTTSRCPRRSWVPMVIGALGLSGMVNLSAVRALRVLKVLRSINISIGLRMLIKAMLDAIPMMSNVLLLLAFVIFMYASIAVQVFAGTLRGVRRAQRPPARAAAPRSPRTRSDATTPRRASSSTRTRSAPYPPPAPALAARAPLACSACPRSPASST